MATETKASPKTSTFSIEGPYLSAGRVNIDLARTDLLWLSLKINAEGGENAVHAHTAEDHSFIVLEGEVTFYDEHGEGKTLGAYEGIMIPKGAYYRYLNTGERNLFMLRVGAGARPRRASPHATSPTAARYSGTTRRTSTSTACPSPASHSATRARP